VRAPFALDDSQIERLKTALSSATGKRIQVKVVVDPSVIGGVVAKVGDTVLDGSVQHRFAELREQWG
jgi:F-type H+-transporting ATPase subunit delta